MKKYIYHPMHMHIHTCFQNGACMESQLYNARKLGMRYIRFTDHDRTLCRPFTPTVDFTCEGLPMGAVIKTTADERFKPHTYTFTADQLNTGMTVRIIADGELICERIAHGGKFEYTYELKPIHTVSFTRVEVWNEEGRCVLLTNPIYTVNTDSFAGDIPQCRLYGG